MPDFDYTEKRFEEDIEQSLLTHGGYQNGNALKKSTEQTAKNKSWNAFPVL